MLVHLPHGTCGVDRSIGLDTDDLAQGNDLFEAGGTPDLQLFLALDRVAGVPNRGHELAFEAPDVGTASLAEHHDRLAAPIEEKALVAGGGEILERHTGRTFTGLVAILGMLGIEPCSKV